MADVFISYSRKDKEFVKTLHTALESKNQEAWVDWENIPLTADWWQEIERGIEAASTFVFILSPDSIASKVCNQEIDHAVKHNKRLVPIVRRDDFATSQVHSALRRHNWLFFREQDDFDTAFADLLKAIAMDLDHVHAHTRFLVRAIEWEQRHRDDSLLLRGTDLKLAGQWLAQASSKEPHPTSLQTEYVLVSGRAEIQRQRRAKVMATVGLVGAIVLALTAFFQYQQARQRQLEAEKGQILALSASASANLASNQDIEALIAAVKLGQQLKQATNPDEETRSTAMRALQQVVYGVKEQNRLEGHNDYVWEASFSPGGQTIATVSDDKTVKLWQRDGVLLRTLKPHTFVRGVSFSPDGQTIATANFDRTVQLWSVEGKRLKPLVGHQDRVTSVVFSPDGQTIASASTDNTAKLWKRDGLLLRTFKGHRDQVSQVSFSPNGQMLATASFDRTIKLWQLDGTLVRTLKGHRGAVLSVSFNPKGKTLASASEDGTIKLWQLDGTLIKTIKAHSGSVSSVQFSPDGQTLASGGDSFEDKTIKLWKLDGTLLGTLKGHNSWISSLSFSPDGHTLLSTSADGTTKFWQLDSPLLRALKSTDQWINDVKFSADSSLIFTFYQNSDGNTAATLFRSDGRLVRTIPFQQFLYDTDISPTGGLIAVATGDNRIMIWHEDGTLQRTFPHANTSANFVQFSSDGQTLATFSHQDNTLRLWTLEGKLIQSFSGSAEWARGRISPDLRSVLTFNSSVAKLWQPNGKLLRVLRGHRGEISYGRFSQDSQTIVTSSYDRTAKLWTLDGKLITTLKGHTAGVTRVIVSPDGQYIATSSEDNTIKLWKQDGTLITTLKIDSFPSTTRFSADSKTLSFVANGTAYLWKISDLNSIPTLMAQGCILLQDYLISHPQQLLELETCQNQTTLLSAARTLAKLEDISNAVKLFHKALEKDPNLNLDPEREAQQLANQGKAQRLVEEGQDLALDEKISAAIAKFQEALRLNPELTLNPQADAQQLTARGKAERLFWEGYVLSTEGNLEATIAKFREVVQLNPDSSLEPEKSARQFVAWELQERVLPLIRQGKIDAAIALLNRAETILPLEFHNVYFDVVWNATCGGGSLWNQPEIVMPICEKAVAANLDNGEYRDRRGLARAMTGDIEGAIADFQAFIEWTEDDERKAQRQRWIQALQAGKNPFTPEELKKLREKEL